MNGTGAKQGNQRATYAHRIRMFHAQTGHSQCTFWRLKAGPMRRSDWRDPGLNLRLSMIVCVVGGSCLTADRAGGASWGSRSRRWACVIRRGVWWTDGACAGQLVGPWIRRLSSPSPWACPARRGGWSRSASTGSQAAQHGGGYPARKPPSASRDRRGLRGL